MKFIRTSLFAAALALGTTAAMAADDITPPGVGPYVSLLGGVDTVESGPLQVNGIPANLKFKDGWALIAAGGYKWNDVLRTELEFSHRSNSAKDVNANTNPASGSQQDTSIMANALLDIPTNSRWTPYVGVGLGVAFVNFNQIHTATSSVYDGTSGKFAWQGIVGVSYAIAPKWELLGEFRYKGSNNHSYNGSSVGNQATQYNDRARDILIGVRYSFGAPPAAAPAAPPPAPMPAPMATPKAPPPAPPVQQKFLVFFDFDKSNLRDDAKKIVSEAAQYAKSNGKTTITATGHTDTSGSVAYNMALSERRAQAVQKELEKLGIPASEIVVHWKGKSEPLVQTGDGVKEPQNRRVEIVLE